MGVWPSGIWSNIFSLNLLDAWYDLTSSDDTWKQHIKNKIRTLSRKGRQRREPGMRPLSLQMLRVGGGAVRGRPGQAFPDPSLDQCLFFWAQRSPLPPR